MINNLFALYSYFGLNNYGFELVYITYYLFYGLIIAFSKEL